MSLSIHAPTKTRRLVSAWTQSTFSDRLLDHIRPYADIFDQVVFMCGAPAPDGKLPGRWSAAERKRLTAELAAMEISVLNDYGGRAPQAPVATDKAARARFVEAVLADADATGAVGIDIDFESWPAETRFAYTDLMADLSSRLHEAGKLLSFCVITSTPEARREMGAGFIDPVAVAPLADQVRNMTYDLFHPNSLFVGPTSVAPWGRETMDELATMVPAKKIVMGLPTYSVDWDLVQNENSRQVYDAAFIAERETESPIGRGWCYWLDVGMIRYTDAEQHPHLLYVSDARSTRSHLVTVDSRNLAGICFWVMCGTEDTRIYDAVRSHFARA